MSIDSTQRVNDSVFSSASRSISATWRGFLPSGLANCMAAVEAKSPWEATLGDSKAALAAAPGSNLSNWSAKTISSSCLMDSML